MTLLEAQQRTSRIGVQERAAKRAGARCIVRLSHETSRQQIDPKPALVAQPRRDRVAVEGRQGRGEGDLRRGRRGPLFGDQEPLLRVLVVGLLCGAALLGSKALMDSWFATRYATNTRADDMSDDDNNDGDDSDMHESDGMEDDEFDADDFI